MKESDADFSMKRFNSVHANTYFQRFPPCIVKKKIAFENYI